MANLQQTKEFGRWRRYVWPIHRYELRKLIPMLFIFFFISFDYNVLRTLKDTLLVTAKSSGAEVIPFVKVWAMFPGAILMTLLFTYLSNFFKRETVFYIMMSLFLIYFFIFTFFLYPARDSLHPDATADYLQTILPVGFKGFIAMFRYWTFTIFYVMSELWSSVILTVLFWGFANQVTRLSEAKRFYGLFGLGANISGIAAGQVSVFCCGKEFFSFLPFGENPWHQSLILLTSLILLAGVFSIIIFRWLNKHVLSDPLYCDSVDEKPLPTEQKKVSLLDNIRYLLRSRYLVCIALIVVCYNVVINLCEVVWKHEVKALYPDPNDYAIYMNEIVTIVGVISTLVAVFISGNSIRKCGWTFTALLTPLILLVTSVGFFGMFLMKHSISSLGWISMLGASPLAVVVLLGSIQNVMSRAAKYSVYDATKEMAFIPLSTESKLVGKAAIDGVGSRLGKSGGALIHQGLLVMFDTITKSTPYVAICLFAVIFIWISATRYLGKQFNSLSVKHPSQEPIPATAMVDHRLQEQVAS